MSLAHNGGPYRYPEVFSRASDTFEGAKMLVRMDGLSGNRGFEKLCNSGIALSAGLLREGEVFPVCL